MAKLGFLKRLTSLVLVLMLTVAGFALAEESQSQDEEDSDFDEYMDEMDIDVRYEWPSDLFPDMPVFAADSYEVWVTEGSCEIYLPAGTDAGFADYTKALTDIGANLYVQNDLLTVLTMGDTEIHLMPDEEQPMISFLNEPAYDYQEDVDLYPGLTDYPMPQSGRLVSLEGSYDYGSEDEDTETLQSMILTYRCASIADALAYCEDLTAAGWVAQEQGVPEGNTLYASYVRAGKMIIVDYYSNSSDYILFFGFAD
jgi:hypothetical protein